MKLSIFFSFISFFANALATAIALTLHSIHKSNILCIQPLVAACKYLVIQASLGNGLSITSNTLSNQLQPKSLLLLNIISLTLFNEEANHNHQSTFGLISLSNASVFIIHSNALFSQAYLVTHITAELSNINVQANGINGQYFTNLQALLTQVIKSKNLPVFNGSHIISLTVLAILFSSVSNTDTSHLSFFSISFLLQV
jgi:hypothetical protein